MYKILGSAAMLVAAGVAVAAGFGLKPGLWESRITKEVVDGRDVTAQITAAAAQLQHAMANLPAEQRARMAAMMKERSGPMLGSGGNAKICISAEAAHRDKPVVDADGRCQPSIGDHSGTHTSFTFNCSANGNVTNGKGESTSTGDVITSVVDMTTRAANGAKRVTHSESEMKFIGSNCGDVKPINVPKNSP